MLINLRNALMTGKRLPYDAEVEYLESTGTQWIDTGVISDGTGLTIEVTCSKTTSATQEMAIVGRSRSDGFDLYVLNSKFELWNSSGRVAKNPTTISAGEVYDVIGSTMEGRVSLSVDGVNSFHSSVYSFPDGNIVLFRHNSKYYWVGRLMFCKIYQNNVLVRDYIPVRVGTVGYLYDRVSGKLFGNAGTGDFVLGPDVVPVEYIESHGTEYIDTGFKASNSTRIAVDFERTGGTNPWIFGARDGSATATDKFALFCSTSSNTVYAMLGSAAGQFSSATIKTGRHLLEMSLAGGVVVDSQVVITYSASEQAEVFSAAYAIALFNLWNGSSLNNPFIGKYYACDFWDNGDPVRKFLPIRVGSGSTWEGAMMDVLTRRIYRNAGTGAFAYGNDLKYPIPAE